MRASWEIGTTVAILLSIAVWLLGLVNFTGMISLILLLCGLWTVVAAFTVAPQKDRRYFLGWGVVIGGLSLFNFISLDYTIAFIIIAIIALIIINVYIGKTPKIYEAATNPTPAGGGTPAAK